MGLLFCFPMRLCRSRGPRIVPTAAWLIKCPTSALWSTCIWLQAIQSSTAPQEYTTGRATSWLAVRLIKFFLNWSLPKIVHICAHVLLYEQPTALSVILSCDDVALNMWFGKLCSRHLNYIIIVIKVEQSVEPGPKKRRPNDQYHKHRDWIRMYKIIILHISPSHLFHPNAWSHHPLPTHHSCQVRTAGPRGRLGPVWPGLYGWPAGEALQVLPEERALEGTQMGWGGWGWRWVCGWVGVKLIPWLPSVWWNWVKPVKIS